jgi:hypothetical protein
MTSCLASRRAAIFWLVLTPCSAGFQSSAHMHFISIVWETYKKKHKAYNAYITRARS